MSAERTGFLFRIRRGLAARARNHWYRNHRLYGRIIELLGNKATVDGIRVQLDNPAITMEQKVAFPIGEYEQAERYLLRHLPVDLPLIDLGASIGVISCLANRRLTDPRSHVAVEANPRLISSLEENRDLNNCKFKVLHAALAYGSETVDFHLHTAFTSGSVNGDGQTVTVPARTLRSIVEEEGMGRFCLICDIEGGERELIDREGDLLAGQAAAILIEMHPAILGVPEVARLEQRILDLGFHLTHQSQDVRLFAHNPRSPAP